MIIDSHVNLHAPQFDDDRDAVIARAREAGVRLMVEISDKLSTFDATHALAMNNADIWCTVGVHPHEAKDYADLTADRLVELAQRPRVIGIGECGCSVSISRRRAAPACRWSSIPVRRMR